MVSPMLRVNSLVSADIGNTLTNIQTWNGVMYNVLQNGLIGDGTTDDTAALQTLINTAIAAGRKAIFFPHTTTGGTYFVTALTNADQVVFFGDNASFIGGYVNRIWQIGNDDLWVSDSISRQAIINGNFDIWQRDTSFSNPTSSSYTSDRWKIIYDGTGMSHSISQQSFVNGQIEVPNNPSFFIRIAVTVAATGQTFNQFSQPIENVRNFSGKTVSISFWAKADTSRVINYGFNQSFGSGGSSTVFVTKKTANLSTTWQKFTGTFQIPSISGKTIGANNYLDHVFLFPNNSTFTIDIAQVQVNVGDVSLPVQPKTFAQELQDCLRYYEKSYNYTNFAGTNIAGGETAIAYATNALQGFTFKVRKRVSPTITLYSRVGTINKVGVATSGTDAGTTVTSTGFERGAQSAVDSGTGFTVGTAYVYHWTADADL